MRKKFISLFAAAAVVCLFVSAQRAAGQEEGRALPIIMYHQVSTSPAAWGDYIISPETFEGDLEYLASHDYQTVTTRELLAYSRGEGTLPEKPVLITFDDGYESFSSYVLPALEKHGMSAVIAVVGKYADTYTQTEDHNLSYSYFSWPALAELQKSPNVELAVHTYDMHELGERRGCKIKPGESASAYGQALNADLSQVEGLFLEYMGEKPAIFAYPYGFSCKEAVEILRQRGYQMLFICEERVNTLTGDPEELMSLGRFNRPASADREQFFSRALG